MINLLFAGDFAPCGSFERIVLQKQSAIFGDALNFIQSADMSFVNLECPLTTHNQAINKSGPALKANPACAQALTDFRVVGLANNHILDFGAKGLADTIEACNAQNLPVVGAGMDLTQAKKPFIIEVKGVKIAIIAISEHEFNQAEINVAGSAPIDPIDNYQQIKLAQQETDIVFVTLHGGIEYFPYPRPGLRKLCQHFIDLGVEAVICHHPHVPGAYEYYQGKPIVYSLGNCIFDETKPPNEWELGYMAILEIDVENKSFAKLELTPYKQSVELGGIKLLQGDEKKSFLQKIDSLKAKLDNQSAWLNEWQAFVEKQADSYILRQYSPLLFPGIGLLARNTPLTKLLFNKTASLAKHNMIRCQSHHELLKAVLETKSLQKND
jgi:capsule synthesis protein PGA_cap